MMERDLSLKQWSWSFDGRGISTSIGVGYFECCDVLCSVGVLQGSLLLRCYDGVVSIVGISTAVWRPLRVAGMAICGTVPGRRAVGIVYLTCGELASEEG